MNIYCDIGICSPIAVHVVVPVNPNAHWHVWVVVVRRIQVPFPHGPLEHGSRMSSLQVGPENPGGQVQLKLPCVLVQVPLFSQRGGDRLHSLTSTSQRVSVQPLLQIHSKVPSLLEQFPFKHGSAKHSLTSVRQSLSVQAGGQSQVYPSVPFSLVQLPSFWQGSNVHRSRNLQLSP